MQPFNHAHAQASEAAHALSDSFFSLLSGYSHRVRPDGDVDLGAVWQRDVFERAHLLDWLAFFIQHAQIRLIKSAVATKCASECHTKLHVGRHARDLAALASVQPFNHAHAQTSEAAQALSDSFFSIIG